MGTWDGRSTVRWRAHTAVWLPVRPSSGLEGVEVVPCAHEEVEKLVN
jgi:hypothetical protein